MIVFKQTNLLASDAEALVNTVNTQGIMGKGIALQFKEKFPLNFKLYQKACKEGNVHIGKMFVTETNRVTGTKYIINFPTKTTWRSNSRIEYIVNGLRDLVQVIREKQITSISLPPLGCGNGGLDWNEVRQIIISGLEPVKDSIYIEVFEPGHHSYSRTTKSDTPKLTKARALILALADKYHVLGFDLSHLEIQKLAYFLQEFGQRDLKLHFTKGAYGPYASNLKHLLAYLEGYYFKGQIRFQDMKPVDALLLVKERMSDVQALIDKDLTEEEKIRLEKVIAFIEGFESPFGLELLATTHWAEKELKSTETKELKQFIDNWSSRKRELFNEQHIAIAVDRIKSSTSFI